MLWPAVAAGSRRWVAKLIAQQLIGPYAGGPIEVAPGAPVLPGYYTDSFKILSLKRADVPGAAGWGLPCSDIVMGAADIALPPIYRWCGL
jgi:hypothetical protein